VFFVKSRPIYRVGGIVVATLATIFLLLGATTFVPEFLQVRHIYKSGNSVVVVGIVEDFHPAPPLGPAKESFSIKQTVFSYNALDPTPCFHNAPFRHGPIRAGLMARVYYNGSCIQRVEIKH